MRVQRNTGCREGIVSRERGFSARQPAKDGAESKDGEQSGWDWNIIAGPFHIVILASCGSGSGGGRCCLAAAA